MTSTRDAYPEPVLLVERQRGSYVPLLAIPLYIVNFHVSSFFLTP